MCCNHKIWYNKYFFVFVISLSFLLYLQNVLANGANRLQLEPTSSLNELQKASASLFNKSTSFDQYDPKNLFSEASPSEEQVFNGIARDAMPMTPEQIIKLKEMLAATQRATSASAGTPPKPTLSTKLVSLSPGALPPVIRLQQGFVTSVVFVDETGADWGIESYDLGNSKAFNIQWEKGSNVVMIQAINMYTYGNVAVKLKSLSTPVMLTLVPGQQVVDYRVDLRIQKYGPNAKPISVVSIPSSANDVLLGVLDGIAPSGSTILNVKGGDCTAWLWRDRMYLRTGLTILSPGWIGVMTSPDGTNAYEMEKSSTILVSKHGKPVELKIEGL